MSLIIAQQNISSGGSVTSSSVVFTPLFSSGGAQSIAGAAAGSGGPCYVKSALMAVCTNPSNATPLTTPANVQLQLTVDNAHWQTVAQYVFSSVPLFQDAALFVFSNFTGPPSSYGLPGLGSAPIAWQSAQLVMNGAIGGTVAVQASTCTVG